MEVGPGSAISEADPSGRFSLSGARRDLSIGGRLGASNAPMDGGFGVRSVSYTPRERRFANPASGS